MLNRRSIRIKVLLALYTTSKNDNPDIQKDEKKLIQSVDKLYELYLYLLMLLVELRKFAEKSLRDRKTKLLTLPEDKNPNRSFINNPLLLMLEHSSELRNQRKKHSIFMDSEYELVIKNLFRVICKSNEYILYMEQTTLTFDIAKKFIANLFRNHIMDSEIIQSHLTEKNIHWASDLLLASAYVIRTIDTMTESREVKLIPLFREEEDKEYMLSLFRNVLVRDKENMEILKKKISNWKPDRIASIDMLLLKMALTEILAFEDIPVKVTLNEYIEISKQYSSPDSHSFINGILDAIVKELRNRNELVKTGKGLME